MPIEPPIRNAAAYEGPRFLAAEARQSEARRFDEHPCAGGGSGAGSAGRATMTIPGRCSSRMAARDADTDDPESHHLTQHDRAGRLVTVTKLVRYRRKQILSGRRQPDGAVTPCKQIDAHRCLERAQ